MRDQEEWGPWIEHDGRGCPVEVGTFVRVDIPALGIFDRLAGCSSSDGTVSGLHGRHNENGVSHWVGNVQIDPFVISRYRIRKPRGMTVLEALLQDLPEEVDA